MKANYFFGVLVALNSFVVGPKPRQSKHIRNTVPAAVMNRIENSAQGAVQAMECDPEMWVTLIGICDYGIGNVRQSAAHTKGCDYLNLQKCRLGLEMERTCGLDPANIKAELRNKQKACLDNARNDPNGHIWTKVIYVCLPIPPDQRKNAEFDKFGVWLNLKDIMTENVRNVLDKIGEIAQGHGTAADALTNQFTDPEKRPELLQQINLAELRASFNDDPVPYLTRAFQKAGISSQSKSNLFEETRNRELEK